MQPLLILFLLLVASCMQADAYMDGGRAFTGSNTLLLQATAAYMTLVSS